MCSVFASIRGGRANFPALSQRNRCVSNIPGISFQQYFFTCTVRVNDKPDKVDEERRKKPPKTKMNDVGTNPVSFASVFDKCTHSRVSRKGFERYRRFVPNNGIRNVDEFVACFANAEA